MKSFIVKMLAASIACLSNVVQAAEFTAEDGVIIMNDNNWKEEVNKNNFLMTMIYAPWCSHCSEIAPEIKSAAKFLSDVDRPIGVMNGDLPTSDKTMKELKIDGFPTLLWYVHGHAEPYKGRTDRKSLAKFIMQQTGLEAMAPTYSEELECDKILKVSKAHTNAAFMFGNKTSMFFNFYQNMQNEFTNNRKLSGEDQDMIKGKLNTDGTEQIDAPHVKLPRFKYFHSKGECIKQFFKDSEVPPSQGALVVISPGNEPQKIQDEKAALGFDPRTMAKFIERFTEPAFQRVTKFNEVQILQPNRQNPEKKQVTFLISRNAQAELGFKALEEVAIKQKYYMNYYYVSSAKPSKKEKKAAEKAQENSKAFLEDLQKQIDKVKGQEKKGGTMTKERKDHNDKVNKEAEELTNKLDKEGYKFSPEELDVINKQTDEKTFQFFMKNFSLKESDLPVIYHYDPLGQDDPPMYSKVNIHQRDITVEKMVKEADMFIGQWKKPVAKSEPKPADDGLALKTIVGIEYEMIASNPNSEALINHAVDYETYCKMLAPEFIKLAEVLKEVKGLTLGTYDPEKNAVGFVHHKSFPTVIHYTKTNKRGRKIKFANKRGKQIESFIKYLSKHSDAYKAHMEANPKFDPIALAKTIVVKTKEQIKADQKKEADAAAAAKAKAEADKAAEKKKQEDVVDLDEEPQKVEKKEEKKQKKATDEKKADL